MVFGKQKYIFPIENNHANNAYHPSANPVCDGFLALLDDIVTLGFFARKVIEKEVIKLIHQQSRQLRYAHYDAASECCMRY